MQRNRLELYSPLPPDECASRLSKAIAQEGRLGFSLSRLFSSSSQPVAGWVGGDGFQLRKRITYRNSFQTYASGSLTPNGSGTSVRAEFGMSTFTRVFMWIWFGWAIVIGGVVFVSALVALLTGSGPDAYKAWMGVVGLPLMLVLGYALVRFGRYLARDEERFLTDFLRQVLDAPKS